MTHPLTDELCDALKKRKTWGGIGFSHDDMRAAYDLAIEHIKEAAKERVADMIHRKGEGFLAVECAYFLDNVIHKVSPLDHPLIVRDCRSDRRNHD